MEYRFAVRSEVAYIKHTNTHILHILDFIHDTPIVSYVLFDFPISACWRAIFDCGSRMPGFSHESKPDQKITNAIYNEDLIKV